MTARETVTALVLAGALALASPTVLHASTALAPALKSEQPAVAENRSGTFSLVQGDDGSLSALVLPSAAGAKDTLRWKASMSDTSGTRRTLEFRIANLSIDGLGSDSEVELVSIDADSGALGIGCTSAESATCRAAYTISIRLAESDNDGTVDAVELVPKKSSAKGGLRAKTLADKQGATMAPTLSASLNAALTARQDAKDTEPYPIDSEWKDFEWTGSGRVLLGIVTQDAASSEKSKVDSAETARPKNVDREAAGDIEGIEASQAPSGTIAGTASSSANQDEGAPPETDTDAEASTDAMVVDAESDLAQALPSAEGTDPDNFTATVATDRSATVNANISTYADDPTREWVVLTLPATYELLFLPSGEVVAPTVYTVRGSNRAYDDIKDIQLLEKQTDALLELYATEEDGSVTKEFDGTTYLKGYRRIKVQEDFDYTMKLVGLDYAKEQDLIMAAIDEPQKLFILYIIFMPIIP